MNIHNTENQREIYNAVTKSALLKIQTWLCSQPMEHLGGLLNQANAWRRSTDNKQAVAGQCFYQQVLFAMSPHFDGRRQDKPSGIPND